MMNKPSLAVFLSRLSQRERFIFYAAVFFVAAALLNNFVISPVLSRMKQLDDKIKNQQEQIKKSLMILSYEKKILREKDKYLSALSDWGSEEEAITTFLKEIENLAKESSVYLVDIKPSGKTEKSGPQQYFLELNFEAEMEQVLNFFYQIVHSDQLIKIERYRISPKTEGSNVISCSMSISKLFVPK